LHLVVSANLLNGAWLAGLAPPRVLHYLGHITSAPGGAGRFPAEQEAGVAAAMIPWHFHGTVTDWYFVLEGALSIETRAPADHQRLTIGGTYRIPPKTAHLVANRSGSDTRFLLVQGVGAYDFFRVAGLESSPTS